MLILLHFLFIRKDEKPNNINECAVKSDRLLGCPLPPADLPDSQWLFSGQADFFRVMANHKTFALAQLIFNLLRSNFDVQHAPAIGQGKPKYSVILRRSPWRERQYPVIVTHTAKPINEHHPGASHRRDMATILHVASDI